jgi:DNA processing protein
MSVASSLDSSFPARLRQLARVPDPLWFVGRLPARGERGVAIVGSRAASAAGCVQARAIAAELAGAGLFIVSGGALGIDAAAHQGALDAGGTTFAVLGCGADVIYPDRHAKLFARIAERGGLISEFPPGFPPRSSAFPQRNRIVAAMAEAVVVIDARRSSGALITARLAREQGRPLGAVPGSAGTDQLIASGLAAAVGSGADVLKLLAGGLVAARAVAPPDVAPVLAAIEAGADSAVAIARQLGVSLSAALGALAEAELGGWVRRRAGGLYEVSRGS